MRTLTVPGSLLLAGEYAITDEGGLGVALAVRSRLVLKAAPAGAFSFSGGACGRAIADNGLVAAVRGAVAARAGLDDADRVFPVALQADSSAFFDADGNKTGLGSSAALAVAVAAALVAARPGAGLVDSAAEKKLVLESALAGHRAFQGGGSGYDVVTSFQGGAGLFRGGPVPTWEKLPAREWLRKFLLFRGPVPVRSAAAVRGYRAWQGERPELAARFVACGNRSVRALASAGDFAAARRALAVCRRIGCWIGAELGLETEPPALSGPVMAAWRAGGAAKASGAGGELAFAFGADAIYFCRGQDRSENGMSEEGILWQ